MPTSVNIPADIANADFGYDYPNGMNLKPGSEFHSKLLRRVIDRAQLSYNVMSSNWNGWEEMDRKLRAFVPASRIENRRKSENEGKTYMFQGEELVIPLTYAVLQAHTTYMMKAFVDYPIFRYEGVGPEDVQGAAILEFVINHQARRNNMGLSLYTAFRDAFIYGFGAISPIWTKESEGRRIEDAEGDFDLTGTFKAQKIIRRKQSIQYEGNKLYNIDPYKFLPDPNAPIQDIQSGEFISWIDKSNVQNLLDEELTTPRMFNAQYANMLRDRTSVLAAANRRTQEQTDTVYGSVPAPEKVLNPIDVLWMYVRLIPSSWELGNSDRPELWLFQIAADKVILQAHKVNLDHGMYPIATCAPDFDGYTSCPPSRISIIQDLQEIVDFLFTSRIANIRKSLHGQYVVDPYMVNIPDLADPSPGKIIRLRKSVWGKVNVDAAVSQLPVEDVTAGIPAEIQFIQELMQQTTSAQDQVMGFVGPRTTRISASEVQGARSSSLSRLETTAQIISMQMMQPLAKMLASQTIQLMSQTAFFRLGKDASEQLRDHLSGTLSGDRAAVSPFDISVNYDVLASDGTVPGSQSVDNLIQLYQIMASNPLVAQQVDMMKFFKNIARELGVKNIDDFIQQQQQAPPQPSPAVASNEQVEQDVQAGNLVPLEEANAA